MKPVLVIGDVHGRLDRLEALLRQEGIIDRCSKCDGSGQEFPERLDNWADCPHCHGDGWARTDKDCFVIQLGDLGHFGKGGSPTGDMLCYRAAYNGWVDVVLWGNHDRSVVDETHTFKGALPAQAETQHYIAALHNEGRLQLAMEAHGFLITHAGLAMAFKGQKVHPVIKEDLSVFVEWINHEDEVYLDTHKCDPQAMGIRDAISSRRGGSSAVGGILWRDINEKLYTGFRQIFGHSANREHVVRYAWKHWFSGKAGFPPAGENISYCIDIGGKGKLHGDACLAGIWLPSEEIVRVDL